jgi:hypothetical protein
MDRVISPTHKRTEGHAPVWGSKFTKKVATLQEDSAEIAATLFFGTYFVSWLSLSRFSWRAVRPHPIPPPFFGGGKVPKKENRRRGRGGGGVLFCLRVWCD